MMKLILTFVLLLALTALSHSSKPCGTDPEDKCVDDQTTLLQVALKVDQDRVSAQNDDEWFATENQASVPNLVQNGDCEVCDMDGRWCRMRDWEEFVTGNRISGAHIHQFPQGGKTCHLHGYCWHSWGGIKQTLAVTAGLWYRMSFKYWGGSWNGHNWDRLTACAWITCRIFTADHRHEIQDGPGAYMSANIIFRAPASETAISFWAARRNCIDIDDVQVSLTQVIDLNRRRRGWAMQRRRRTSGGWAYPRRRRSTGSPTAPRRRRSTGDAVTATTINEMIDTWASENKVPGFTILAGDQYGTRYLKKHGTYTTEVERPGVPSRPLLVFSAGKWCAAAAFAAAVLDGKFTWTTQVNNYILWWNGGSACTNADGAGCTVDGRSQITFQHLLSHQSGVVAAEGNEDVSNQQLFFVHVDVGYHNESIALEDSAKLIHEHTSPSITPPERFRYGETHWIVAQLAAMKATSNDQWQTFFHTYWGTGLGLKIAKVHKTWAAATRTTYFEDDGDTSWAKDDRGYGYWAVDRNTPWLQNPDAGSQLIMSPCAGARFMKDYVMQGETRYQADSELDRVHAQATWTLSATGKYCLGHWVLDSYDPPLFHSMGMAGSSEMMSRMWDGTKFWAYLNQMEVVAGSMSGEMFATSIMPYIGQLFSSDMPTLVTAADLGCYIDPVTDTRRRRGWR